MPHVLGLKQKEVYQRVALFSGICLKLQSSFAETKERKDKRSCKQSADQLSNTCAPCPQHNLSGESLGGGAEGMWMLGGGPLMLRLSNLTKTTFQKNKYEVRQ